MKVGIVTFRSGLNVGGLLQAFALQKTLETLGHTVEFVDYQAAHKYTWRSFVAKTPRRIIYNWMRIYNSWRYRNFRDVKCLLHIGGSHYKKYEELEKNPPDYDVYIVGSDQVWNFTKLNSFFLLDFVPKGKKKIAYAASMGQCYISKEISDEIRKRLNQFSAISLREDKAVTVIKNLLGRKDDVYKTLDPTLLIDREIYERIMNKSLRESGTPYIASYILGHIDVMQKKSIRELSRKWKMPIVNLQNIDTGAYIKGAKNKVVSIYQWLSYIQNSQFVICGSFHATVFSLIFHKPFIVIQSNQTKVQGGNVRISSLLKMVNLENHIIYDDDVTEMEKTISDEINWHVVDSKVKEQRDFSISFLQKNLN